MYPGWALFPPLPSILLAMPAIGGAAVPFGHALGADTAECAVWRSEKIEATCFFLEICKSSPIDSPCIPEVINDARHWAHRGH